MTGRGPGSRGFTLLEIVAALAIFALAVTVLSTAYAAGITARGAIRADRERETVVRYVSETVAALPGRAEVAAGGTGRLPAGQEMRWQARVTPLDYTGLYAVDISLEYGRPAAVGTERLELYRPAWATPAEAQAWKRLATERWQQKRER